MCKKRESIQSKFKNLDIVLENYALGSERKKLFITQLPESSSSTINKIDENSKYFKRKNFFLNLLGNNNLKKEIEISQIRLSDYMKENKILKVDFLKIDTEGYEFNVLLGLGEYLQNVSLVMFEHHYHDMLVKNYSFRDIHNLLKKNRFQQIYKYKMPFRKTFEYVYKKQFKG